jgi:hypothetical protein
LDKIRVEPIKFNERKNKMNNNKNDDSRNKMGADMSVILVTCFISLTGAALAANGSATTVKVK